MIREHLDLFPYRRDQAVGLPAMLHAFADGVDARIVDRAHLVVDHDRAFDREAGLAGDFRIGLDAGGEDHQVAFESLAVFEFESADALVAEDSPGIGAEMNPDAHLFHQRLQDSAGGSIKLLVHQVGRAMDDVDFETETLQPVRAFKPEQTAADHRRALFPARVVRHAAAIVKRAKPEDAGFHAAVALRQPGQRRNEGAAAGRDDQIVVRLFGSVGSEHAAGEAEDARGVDARMQPDAVLLVPCERIENDFGSPA